MSQLAFVIPGWYKNRHTSGDVTQTIRVIGGGDKGNDYFKLMDGTEMHEHQILDDWIYMPTAMNQDSNDELFVLGDFSEQQKIEPEPQIELNKKIYEQPNTNFNPQKVNKENFIDYSEETKRILVENSKLQKIIETTPIINISEEEIFIDQLLKQISDNQIAKNTSFEIPIQFHFKYDLNKLKQILTIIGPDDKKINLLVNKIILNDLDDIQLKITESIKNFLIKDNVINDISHEKIKPTIDKNVPKSFSSTYLDKNF